MQKHKNSHNAYTNQYGGSKPSILELKDINLFTTIPYFNNMEQYLNPIYGCIWANLNIVNNFYEAELGEIGDLVRTLYNKNSANVIRPTNALLWSENRIITPYSIGVLLTSYYLYYTIKDDDRVLRKYEFSLKGHSGKDQLKSVKKTSKSNAATVNMIASANNTLKSKTHIPAANNTKPPSEIVSILTKYNWLFQLAVSESHDILTQCNTVLGLMKRKSLECENNIKVIEEYFRKQTPASIELFNKLITHDTGILRKSRSRSKSRSKSVNASNNEDELHGNKAQHNMLLQLATDTRQQNIKTHQFDIKHLRDNNTNFYHVFLSCLWWICNSKVEGIKEYYEGINFVLGGKLKLDSINNTMFDISYLNTNISNEDNFEVLIAKIYNLLYSSYELIPYESIKLNSGEIFSDCGETVILNIIRLMAYDANMNSVNIKVLEQFNLLPKVMTFFKAFNNVSHISVKNIFGVNLNMKQAWNYLLSNIPNVIYASEYTKDAQLRNYKYDIYPGNNEEGKSNLIIVLQYLFQLDTSLSTNETLNTLLKLKSNIVKIEHTISESNGLGNIDIFIKPNLHYRVTITSGHYEIIYISSDNGNTLSITQTIQYDKLSDYHSNMISVLFKQKIPSLDFYENYNILYNYELYNITKLNYYLEDEIKMLETYPQYFNVEFFEKHKLFIGLINILFKKTFNAESHIKIAINMPLLSHNEIYKGADINRLQYNYGLFYDQLEFDDKKKQIKAETLYKIVCDKLYWIHSESNFPGFKKLLKDKFPALNEIIYNCYSDNCDTLDIKLPDQITKFTLNSAEINSINFNNIDNNILSLHIKTSRPIALLTLPKQLQQLNLDGYVFDKNVVLPDTLKEIITVEPDLLLNIKNNMVFDKIEVSNINNMDFINNNINTKILNISAYKHFSNNKQIQLHESLEILILTGYSLVNSLYLFDLKKCNKLHQIKLNSTTPVTLNSDIFPDSVKEIINDGAEIDIINVNANIKLTGQIKNIEHPVAKLGSFAGYTPP